MVREPHHERFFLNLALSVSKGLKLRRPREIRRRAHEGKNLTMLGDEFALLCPLFSGYLSAAQLNVIWTSESGVYAPEWVTKEADLFEKHGNRVQLIFMQGATSAAAALISGDAQIGFLSPQVVLTAGMKGLDLVMVARLGNFVDNQISSRWEEFWVARAAG